MDLTHQPGFHTVTALYSVFYLEYTLNASSDYPLFAYLATEDMHNAHVSVNGKNLGRYFNTYQYHIMRLGSFKKGEKITVRIKLDDTKINITDARRYFHDRGNPGGHPPHRFAVCSRRDYGRKKYFHP